MRRVWGFIVACCLGCAAFAQEAKTSASPNDAGQAPAAVAPQTAPGAEEKQQPKDEPRSKEQPQPTPQSETKSEPLTAGAADASAVQANEPKTAPTAEPPKGEPAEPAPASSPSELKTEPQTKPEPAAAAPKGKRGTEKRTPAVTGEGPAQASAGGWRKVVRQGGVDEPKAQIVTGMTPEEAGRQRQHAEQLLRSTVETLEGLDERAFNTQQQETVSQIHNYMDSARSALKEGDIARAHTLAMKADLLAEDLARH